MIGTEIQNETGSFSVDANGNIRGSHINGGLITGATIRGVNIEGQSIYNAGYKIKNIDVRTYEVAHGDYTPIPDGYSEDKCVFIPISYKLSNDKVGRKEGPNLNYFTTDSPRFPIYTIEQRDKVGLMGNRRAYVARISENNYSQNLKSGYLFVLVIARQ